MQKIVINRRGHYDRLRLERHPAPTVAQGAVHIDVEAIGVNYADCIVRMGLYKSAREYVGWPITPGFEVAGRVARLGQGVEDLTIGQRVMAVTRFGGYASDVVVPRRQVFPCPVGWSTHESAAFPVAGLTAYYALCELAQPPPGSRLLVHSAAGGVGGVLVQLGEHLGHHVVGVVGASHKVGPVRELGATEVIDKSQRDLWSEARRHAPAGYAAVFDANGIETLRQSYRHVAPTGRLVVYGFGSMLPRGGKKVSWLRLLWNWIFTPRFDPMEMTSSNKSVMGFNLSYLFDRTELLRRSVEQLTAWAGQGALRPPKITAYRLSDVAAAHRDIESGRTTGKLVLVPDQRWETT